MKSISQVSLFVLAVILAACGPKQAPPAPPPVVSAPPAPVATKETATPVPSASPVSTEPAPGTTQAKPVEELRASTDVADLTKALQIFMADNKRFPTTVGELKKYSPNGIPTLPAGYRYEFDRQNQRVLIVKQ